MMTRRTIFGWLALGSTASMATACSFFSSETIRYRMTVEVETPNGLRTGSSVIESTVRPTGPGAAVAVIYKVRGEAVAVDIAPGKTLFALLQSQSGDGDAATRYPGHAFHQQLPRAEIDKATLPWLAEYRELRRLKGQSAVLPFPKRGDELPVPGAPARPWPLLVTFGDIRDPKTVEKVDPDNLSARFGPGVKLRRITVQITDDPVTTGIEKRFPWWSTYTNRWFNGKPTGYEDLTTDSLSAHLTSASFSTEFNK